MNAAGIREWSFTRQYDIGEGPWPSTDEATITYESEPAQVIVSGVFIDGDSSKEGCVRRINHVPEERVLHIDLGKVETGQRFAHDIAQRIHYEVCVTFVEQLPQRTMVRHLAGKNDRPQFSTTAIREESE